MITTIAQFKPAKETSIEEARQLFMQSAPDYLFSIVRPVGGNQVRQ